ncbi:hypothetical protein SAMN05880501_10951 [Ureibacillus xyleni]|uniref:Uncharacterized protein n=1 Tax=Ureibacillus xyleni TaxID=614648 RepID=A0A285T5K7_9BACL|nr:hypothetical protein SAMN05880501_10951 [Ureibacillus xyleni]
MVKDSHAPKKKTNDAKPKIPPEQRRGKASSNSRHQNK